MRLALLVVTLLAACAPQPLPPSTPPIPPPPPEGTPNAALIVGRVVENRGLTAENVSVTVRAGDARCEATGTGTGAVTDASGQYSIVVYGTAGPQYEGCVIV